MNRKESVNCEVSRTCPAIASEAQRPDLNAMSWNCPELQKDTMSLTSGRRHIGHGDRREACSVRFRPEGETGHGRYRRRSPVRVTVVVSVGVNLTLEG